jgi:hypothetical protein
MIRTVSREHKCIRTTPILANDVCMALDLASKHRGLWLDFVILLLTLPTVLSGEGE